MDNAYHRLGLKNNSIAEFSLSETTYAYDLLSRQFYGKPWLVADRDRLSGLLSQTHALAGIADRRLAGDILTLEQRMETAQSALSVSKRITTAKKVLLMLGLAFLSASAVRYWMDKLEPVVADYVRHTATANEPPRGVPQ